MGQQTQLELFMSIGSRLKEWRTFINLKQDEAGAKLGIPFSTLKKYEMNSRKPGAEAIEALVKEGVNANWILTGTGPMLIADYSAEQSPMPSIATEPPQPGRAATEPYREQPRKGHAVTEPSRAAASGATGPSQPTRAVTDPSPCPVDITRLTEAIESIEGILTKHRRTMRPAAKARAVTLAYQILEDEDKEKDGASYDYAQKMMDKLIKSIA